MFDLRSDTVTKPSKEIIESAITAELGDDEYIEDPTVNKLEEHCAELLNFEKGLFVSSGLMGNQISLLIIMNLVQKLLHLMIHISKITSTVQQLFYPVYNFVMLSI